MGEVSFDDLRRELVDSYNDVVTLLNTGKSPYNTTVTTSKLENRLNELRNAIVLIAGLQADGFFETIIDDDFKIVEFIDDSEEDDED